MHERTSEGRGRVTTRQHSLATWIIGCGTDAAAAAAAAAWA